MHKLFPFTWNCDYVYNRIYRRRTAPPSAQRYIDDEMNLNWESELRSNRTYY